MSLALSVSAESIPKRSDTNLQFNFQFVSSGELQSIYFFTIDNQSH